MKTVHQRIVWGLTLLSFLTLGILFTAVSLVLDNYQQRELDSTLLTIAREEAEEAPKNAFSFSSRRGPAANDVGPLDKYGIIYDEAGRPLSSTHPFDGAVPPLAEFTYSNDKPFDFVFGRYRLRAIIVTIPGYPNRQLLLASSREDLDSDSRFVRKSFAAALAIAMFWIFGAVNWLVRWTMREHDRIAQTLHRLAGGDLEARIPQEVSDHDVRKVGNDIDEIAQQLGRLIAYQRRFITHAAHELRSPLAAVHGEVQQALRRERTVEEYRKSLVFLQKASGRLTRLTDDLLQLARAERPTEGAEPVSVELTIADVVESLQPLAADKNVTIQVGATDCSARGNARELERVIRNLLDNAIRHSPNGGVVHLAVEAGEMVRISVRDEGGGIPVEERERVFEPFYRAPSARAADGGAGLGLAIARELARKHGGDVAFEGEPPGFVVRLPRWMPY